MVKIEKSNSQRDIEEWTRKTEKEEHKKTKQSFNNTIQMKKEYWTETMLGSWYYQPEHVVLDIEWIAAGLEHEVLHEWLGRIVVGLNKTIN